MDSTKTISGYKSYDELEYRDDFMFGKVMQDRMLCQDVLECLLQQPVGELQEVQKQKEYRYTKDGKPIRLDIFTRDDETYYDAEMQNLGNKSVSSLHLPRRSRFYQSSIDTDFMNAKGHYRDLPESVVMFICTFDPFKKGLARYTFTETCKEDPELPLGDGTTTIYFNCCYKGDDIPKELRSFYDYVETGKCSSGLAERIDAAVREARKIEEWRSDYMKEMVLLMDAKEEGREEGREEERENTDRERARADKAEEDAFREKNRADDLAAELAKYKAKYGDDV